MKQINPHWLKSLAIHAVTLMVATFIGLVVIGNKEAPGMILYSLGAALISPLAYPIVGPYMVAFLLATLACYACNSFGLAVLGCCHSVVCGVFCSTSCKFTGKR